LVLFGGGVPGFETTDISIDVTRTQR